MKISAQLTNRPWWTRERVLRGLLRFHHDTGLAPTSKHEYHRVASARYIWQKGARRRYPPFHQVLFYWKSFAEAWLEVGVEDERRRAAVEKAMALGLRLLKNRVGERHGSLEVVGLAGFRVREYKRRTVRVVLWRCLCDCGRERVVEAGVLGSARPVTSCLECARARTTAAGTAALKRLRASASSSL